MKEIEFCGRSLKVIRSFPVAARREAGYQLDRLQRGYEPIDWKPMASIGKSVKEIRIREHGEYRVIYIAKFEDVVYVLHAFQKKTQKTKKHDIEVATSAVRQIDERTKK